MTNKEIFEEVYQQLSLEFNCRPNDFSSPENIITSSITHKKRRRFSETPFFLQMATFGKNAVISADDAFHPWLYTWIDGKQGFQLFEQQFFYELECELRKHGYKMAPSHHMFLTEPVILKIETALQIRWYEQKELSEFYGRADLPNALCDRFHPERPDVLAVAAWNGSEMMGMAGCSADTPYLWQIGIDVLPEYRSRGVGKVLVSLLRNEAIRREVIPYYGTSLSNILSWKTALACGFFPAWIETETQEI